MIECGPSRGNYGYNPRLEAKLTELAGSFETMVVHGLWQFHGRCASRVSAKIGVPYYVFPHGMLDPWFRRSYPIKHLKKQLYWMLAERQVLEQARAVLFTSEREVAISGKPLSCPRETIAADYPAGSSAGTVRARSVARRVSAKLPTSANPSVSLVPRDGYIRKKGVISWSKRLPSSGLRSTWSWQVQAPVRNIPRTLKRLAAGLPITFTDLIEGEVKASALACAEALILPSHQENFGLVVAEALSFGTPVLLSEQVNISEEVKSSGAGFVEADTLAGTRRLIEHWLEHGEPAMRAAALRCFQQHFNIEQSAQKLLEIIKTEGKEEDLNRR